MKNTSLILSIVSLVAVVVFGVLSLTKGGKTADVQAEGTAVEAAASKGDIVYIDLDRVLMEYDMANDLRSVVETKVQNIQAEVNRRGKKLENDIADFQNKIDKGLMTRSVAEAQGQKLSQQEVEFNNYAAQKQQEINEEQVVMMNQLGDAIQTFINKYNEEKQYAMILTNSGGAPVITADAALDITDDVLAGLNEEYIKSKNNK
ncbi:MAG: OmpH family outer membrane protein [Bacteroidales bacterium]|nr:OmpH family outer membrane protein [Bacteroidales bacterium]